MTDLINSHMTIDPRVGFATLDADQHYYEPEDCLTRHLPHELHRLVRWVDFDGHRRLILDGKLVSKMPNTSFNPIAKPGALSEMFKGNNPEGKSVRELLGESEPTRPEYRERDLRVRVLDEQGVQATIMLPSFGLFLEEHFKHDPDTLYAVIRAYNTWLNEDWPFAYKERIFSGPLLSLIDPAAALAETLWGYERGARFVVLRPSPVTDGLHSWSLGDERHDELWAAIAERNMFVMFHSADSGYEADSARWGEGGSGKASGIVSGALVELLGTQYERPIEESIAAMVAHGVFTRHPTLRVATAELGSKWALQLFQRAKSAYGKQPQIFAADPVETLRKHVWISPFYEDSLLALRDAIGAERIMLGSDWPHPEGLYLPGDYMEHLDGFSPDEVRMVMADNLKELLGL